MQQLENLSIRLHMLTLLLDSFGHCVCLPCLADGAEHQKFSQLGAGQLSNLQPRLTGAGGCFAANGNSHERLGAAELPPVVLVKFASM